MKVRTRFAPSPTGHIHIGNIRTAIFNWLYARHNGGEFLLRLEDTDRERSTDTAVQQVFNVLDWMALDVDEQPVYQSERQTAHLEAAEMLLSKGLAYKEDKGGTGKGEAVVFRIPDRDAEYEDLVKGRLKKKAKDMQDFVIVRSNGTPVFHLANVVDDAFMNVTHVIRGDDHVENTFRHMALYQALDAPLPAFAHLPMIVNAQGKPYSKRDGDAYVGDFREKGYLPQALLNYLSLLGWAPGDDREIFTTKDLMQAFDLDRVQSSPARMDMRKLDWLNSEHIRLLPRDERLAGCRRAMEAADLWSDAIDETYFGQVVDLLAERIKRYEDTPEQAVCFLSDAFEYDEKAVRKRLKKEGAPEALRSMLDAFRGCETFTAEELEAALRRTAEAQDASAGQFIHPVRVAVSGAMAGPGLFDMLVLLGRERVLGRMESTLTRLENGEL